MDVLYGFRLPLRAVPLIAGAALLSMFSMSQAQSQTQSAAATEASAGPALQYQSVLSGYRSFNEQPVQTWRETNDLVRSIGGWRAYAREPAESDTASGAAAKPPSPTATISKEAPAAAGRVPPAPSAAPPETGHQHHKHGSKP